MPGLARSLYGDLWLATVGRADQPFAAEIIQLFADDQLVFLHDGCLSDFSALYCTARDFLDPEIAAEIHGNSDSEHIFALLRHLLNDDAELSIEEALWELLALLDEWLEERAGLLNIVVGDGERIYAVRHAHNSECAPLYYSIDDDDFPDGTVAGLGAPDRDGVLAIGAQTPPVDPRFLKNPRNYWLCEHEIVMQDKDTVVRALAEDVGSGDLTAALIPEQAQAQAPRH